MFWNREAQAIYYSQAEAIGPDLLRAASSATGLLQRTRPRRMPVAAFDADSAPIFWEGCGRAVGSLALSESGAESGAEYDQRVRIGLSDAAVIDEDPAQ